MPLDNISNRGKGTNTMKKQANQQLERKEKRNEKKIEQ